MRHNCRHGLGILAPSAAGAIGRFCPGGRVHSIVRTFQKALNLGKNHRKLCALMQPRYARLAEYARALQMVDFLWWLRSRCDCALKGTRDATMSRVTRDTSWHVFAFILVVVVLSLLTPLASWQGGRHQRWQRSSRPTVSRERGSLGRSTNTSVHETPQPQIAPLGPLIADQITLDPSIRETPAISTGRPDLSDAAKAEPETDGEMRLSAVSRPPQPTVLPPSAIESRPASESLGDSLFSAPEPAIETRAWPKATALLEQLDSLATAVPSAAPWAGQTMSSLTRLASSSSLADPLVAAELANLKRLADEAKEFARQAGDDQSRSKILRAGYALVRRLVIWDIAYSLTTSGELAAAPIVDHQAWTQALAKVDSMLQTTGAAANWRKYLLIDRALSDFDSSSC